MEARAELAAAICAALADCQEVQGAYLFGSQARGDATEASDVDVAVLGVRPLTLDRLVALTDLLERRLGRRVDLIDLWRARPFLALDAVRGERVFARDPLGLDHFDLYVLRRAGDLACFERERRRQLLSAGP